MENGAAIAHRRRLQAFIDEANAKHWWNDHHNLHLTAVFLYEAAYRMDAENVLGLLERPWLWTQEFVNAVYPDGDLSNETPLRERLT